MINDYTELLVEAAERTGDTGIVSHGQMLVGMLETHLNKRLRVNGMENTSTVTTNSDGEATMPTGWIDIKGVYYDDVRVPRRMFSAVEIDFVGWGYYTDGDTLKSNLEGRSLEIRYYKEIPSLHTNGTNWLLTAEPEIYLVGVQWQSAMRVGDLEKATVAKGYLDNLVREFEREDRRKRRSMTEIDMAGGSYQRGNDFTITPV